MLRTFVMVGVFFMVTAGLLMIQPASKSDRFFESATPNVADDDRTVTRDNQEILQTEIWHRSLSHKPQRPRPCMS